MSYPIPDKALAQHIAVLGKTGSGKSYAIRGVVERLLDAKARACIIDPTGIWWGLKSSATGKSGGYPVVIFGGTHADLPLGAAHGEALAEAIGTSSTPAILDTSQMKVGERTRFFADFADALVRKNKGPLHLVIDEAHLFAPQGKVNDPQSGAMLHAANNLVSLGRSKGLRIILITQRPAKLHKDSLTQVETLVAMRLIAPQDRKAVEEWIKDNADQAKGQEIISSLATLKTGQAWVWAPELGVLERVQFPKIHTFDSSRAPDDVGDDDGPVLAPIDREAIAARLKAVAVEADANDPKKLRARIAELERHAKASPAPAMSREDLKTAEAKGYDRGMVAGHDGAQKTVASYLRELKGKLHQAIESILIHRQIGTRPVATTRLHAPKPAKNIPKSIPATTGLAATPRGNGTGEVEKPMPRAMLTALAQHPEGLTKGQILVHTGYRSSGPVSSCFADLLRAGWAQSVASARLQITEHGLNALGPYTPLPTGEALRDFLLSGTKVTTMEKAMLRVLFEEYPQPIAKGQILERTNYASSGPVSSAFARLVALGYAVPAERGALRASEELF